MRNLLYISIIAAAAGIMWSCGNAGKFEKSEATTAEIEAAMVEGRESARIFINKRWADTTELQNNLLEARARRAKYDTIGKKECAAAYDSAFVSTIRTVNPDVARHLK